jgi:hypothetical protein
VSWLHWHALPVQTLGRQWINRRCQRHYRVLVWPMCRLHNGHEHGVH